jgi:hypothetical protein
MKPPCTPKTRVYPEIRKTKQSNFYFPRERSLIMAHNYVVTAQKPTAVNACVTGNRIDTIYPHNMRDGS